MDYLLATFLGAIFGSFANVCIYRLPNNKKVSTGRSFCPKCKKKINPIIDEMSDMFLNQEKRVLNRTDMISGAGYMYGTYFIFENGSYVEVACYEYKKKIDINDNGRVSLTGKDFAIWLETAKWK